MKRSNSIRVLAAFNILSVALAGMLSAQEPENRELRQAKERFAAARERAATALLASFDEVGDRIRRARTPAEAKGDQIARIQSEKAAFRSHGELPESPEVFDALLKYCEAIHKARVPLQKTYRHVSTAPLCPTKSQAWLVTRLLRKRSGSTFRRGDVTFPLPFPVKPKEGVRTDAARAT